MRTSFRYLTGVLLCTIAAAAALAAPARAAVPDAQGTEFWLAFTANAGNASTRSLMITGSEATTGTVEVPGVAFSAPFSVTPGTITTVALPANTELRETGIDNRAVHVTAAKAVTVYGLNRLEASTDAFLGLPVDVLGTRHTVMAWAAGSLSQFAVVASQDATTVTITPAATVGGHVAGIPYDVTLNRGQAYQAQAQTAGELTGSTVVSDKPVAVFGGNQCGYVPNDRTGYCDHLVEQQPPDDAWGTRFLTVPLKTRSGGDTFRILASQAGTEVKINGTTVATLGAGGFHTQLIGGSSEIESSKPVLVAQFANGTNFDGALGDPFMMLIPPVEQYQTAYTVSTPASGFATNVLNLVVPASSVGMVEVDGTLVPAAAFSAIGSSGFSGAQVDVALGTHTVAAAGAAIGVFTYGFGDFDSYGYPGGMSVARIAGERVSLPAVVRSSTTWLLRTAQTTGPADTTFSYGGRPLTAMMGDWDGNGSCTPGTFEGGSLKLRNANSEGDADITVAFGHRRGFAVAGDFDGDNVDDVAIFRGGTWEVRYSTGATAAPFTFGSGIWPATVPVAGDWDGDGVDGIGTYTHATATWNLRNTASGGAPDVGPFVYGTPDATYPVVGDWDADGTDTVGVKQAPGATWSLRDDNSAGEADTTFDFGLPHDLPLSWCTD